MNAYIATITTSTGTTTELLIANSADSALKDAETRHDADAQNVLITIEQLDIGPVIVVGQRGNVIPHPAPRRRPISTRKGRGLYAYAMFSRMNSADIDYREIEIIESAGEGLVFARLQSSGRTIRISTSSIVSADLAQAQAA